MTTESTMQALRLTLNNGSKPALSLSTLPIPSLVWNTALVRIHAAALNPSDILNANGSFHHTVFPRIPGRDYAGIIEAGPGHLVGQEVYGTSGSSLGFSIDGTHAEYCVVPCDSLAQKPSNLSFVQAAAVGVPFTTAALALRRANVESKDVVLVLGASGAVGSAACQLARSRGCRVLTATREDTADVNIASGLDMKAAKDLTDGRGPDVVFDTTGSTDLMRSALMCLAPRGRLAYISAPRSGSTEFTFDALALYRQEKSIIGCNSVLAELADTAAELRSMTSRFESGQLQTNSEEKFEIFSLNEALDAYESMRKGSKKKIVIVP
jgi:NADPH:quinone reductase